MYIDIDMTSRCLRWISASAPSRTEDRQALYFCTKKNELVSCGDMLLKVVSIVIVGTTVDELTVLSVSTTLSASVYETTQLVRRLTTTSTANDDNVWYIQCHHRYCCRYTMQWGAVFMRLYY